MSNSSSDDELDMKSKNFNPLKAIYSTKLNLNASRLPKFDNLSSFLSRLQRAGNALDADLSKVPVATKKFDSKAAKEVDNDKYIVTDGGRTFLREQGKNLCYRKDSYLKFTLNRSSSSWTESQVQARYFR